jgi:anti-sigma-K factor RskA
MQDEVHQPFEDDLAAYLLGALTDDEANSFEAHLETCEICQARERWLRTSVEVLPASVEPVEPPPELRERLLATVRREAGAETEGGAPAPRDQRRGSWWTRLLGTPVLRPATAAAAALLIVAAGAIGYAVRGGGEGGAQTTTVTAQSTGVAPGLKATIVRTGDRGILRVSDLPQRRGRVYEVWLVKGEKPVPSALFQVGRDGAGSAGIPGGLDEATQVLVTSEPEGGSEEPTTKPLLSARV